MVLDWLFSPYCSSGWVAREAARCFDLELRPWDLSSIKDAALVLIPHHISSMVKDIRKKGLHKRTQGAEPLFFIDGKLLGTFKDFANISDALKERGLEQVAEPDIPECFIHPRLNYDAADANIMVQAVNDVDISGLGLPSPGNCLECRFGELGTEENMQFMTEITRAYGRIMSIAFVGSEVAGFISHVPKPVAWRIGCSFVNDLPEKNVLQIIDFYVYPHHRRKGVGRALLAFTKEHCRKTRAERIDAFATILPAAERGPSTGSIHPYLDFGFVQKKVLIEPTNEDDPTQEGLGMAYLQYIMHP